MGKSFHWPLLCYNIRIFNFGSLSVQSNSLGSKNKSTNIRITTNIITRTDCSFFGVRSYMSSGLWRCMRAHRARPFLHEDVRLVTSTPL